MYVLVLSAHFSPPFEAMHTLTVVPPAAECRWNRFENSRRIISERHKKTQEARGLFFYSAMNTLHGLFWCKIYIDCLAYRCIYTQPALSVAAAVNVLVPIAMSLL